MLEALKGRTSEQLVGLLPVAKQELRAAICAELWRRGEVDGPRVVLEKLDHSTESVEGSKIFIVDGEEITVPPGHRLVLRDGQFAVVEDVLSKSVIVQCAADVEKRFTLSAWYIPNRVDAHGDWTDADELQSAVWWFTENGHRDVFLQHDPTVQAGRWVEIVSWPWEVEVEKTNGETVSYPAGTVFLGVVWKEWAWELVKAGKVRGLSIGGYGVRVDSETSP